MDAETRKTLEAWMTRNAPMLALVSAGGAYTTREDAAAIRSALATIDALKKRLVDEAERTNAAAIRSREHSARVSRLAADLSTARAEVDALQSEVAWQGGALDTALAMLSGDSTREDVIEFLRGDRAGRPL